jgi:hypothetical protein
MKIKFLIPILLIMLVFGFAGCNTPKVATVATIAQTETTVAETTVVETTIPETTVVTTAETATETTTGVITASGNPEAFKDAWKKIIEDDGSNKVTKITFSDDGLTFYLNYNNTGDSPDAVETQMYVFLTIMAMNNSNLNVALNGTWRMTTTYHSYTSTENMVRLKNFDLSYGDWVKVAIETTVPKTTAAPTTTIVETTVPETTAPETDSATLAEKNAAKKALDYLAYTSFSYSGLVEQLEYEGYTHEEAVYGVDRCGADWNEQAALKAKQYIDYTSFSRDGLIAQLEYEGFTRQQAEYGAQAVGY